MAAVLERTAQVFNDEARVSIYQPEQRGLIFPSIPKFASFAEERQYRKERLVAACRAFALEGYDYGFAGHLTVRDPEHPELYWTNPMCVHFAQVKVSNLILADHKGRVVEGRHAINRAGFVLHAAVHEAHADIVAMCHAHTVYGTAFAALGRPLEPISQDAAAFFEDHVVIKDEAGQVAVEERAGLAVCRWVEQPGIETQAGDHADTMPNGIGKRPLKTAYYRDRRSEILRSTQCGSLSVHLSAVALGLARMER